ncbi:MAG: DNA repair protein RecO [Gammaproteobacteria bacterium RIFCSPLOWO2_02_FULL_52_10]|nr:MAG: DNA repair protein RecO [Gammaproteobacteria bacterium RIFCSPLOWO2_02_FULL_52_10]
MKIALHPCYILHQRHYRETSLILEVFSRNNGKLTLVARGAKKRNAGTSPLMQINQKLNIAWTIRGEMGTLTAIEAAGTNYNLGGSRLIAAFYMNELLMRLLHKYEPHQELFDTYENALRLLQQSFNEEAILRVFEIELLKSLGYGLVFDHDVISGKPIEQDKLYFYQIDFGPTTTPPQDREYVKLSGKTLIALAQSAIQEPYQLQEAKQLTRRILKNYLGTKPLASRDLFSAYLKNQNG